MINEIYLKNLPFFSHWDHASLIKISTYCQLITLSKNTVVVKQDDTSRDLYILIQGSLSLRKSINQHQVHFGHLKQHDLFGELAFIDGEKRACDVIADDSSEVLAISASIIKSEPELYNKIASQLLKSSTERVRETDNYLVDSLLNQLQLLQSKINTARLFVLSIFLFIIMMLVNRLLTIYKINPYSAYFSWSYLTILAVPFIILILMNKISAKFIGLTTQGLLKKSLVCISIAIPLVVLIYYLSALKLHQSIFNFTEILNPNIDYNIFFVRYFMIAFFQQIFRGVLQTCLQEIFTTNVNLKAILMSAFMFGVMHIHLGFVAIGVTFLAGLLFGYIFSIQRNTYSITLLHGITGCSAYAFRLI